LSENSNAYLIELETRERERTQLSSLKVRYNRVHGYSIEISRAQASKAPAEYIRRQTLKNAERYIIPELKEFENKVLSAQAKALIREKQLYENLLNKISASLAPLKVFASALSELDVLCNLAERAKTLTLSPPTLSTEPGILIKGGRHLVVETLIQDPFIPNDLCLDDHKRMMMITGPNMGGKSTYMRQTALIVLMAYIGSYVPAELATIGPIDRIFTRIGASDDLAGGRSTFMVEMTETANITHYATKQSLVLMDETGRGTSTFDGLSIAWALAEHLAYNIKAYTLFSTHYFELTALEKDNSPIKNVHLDATEYGEQIVFLHSVKSGPANQSYGLQVAQLAGIPASIILQAKIKLKELETTSFSLQKATSTSNPPPHSLYSIPTEEQEKKRKEEEKEAISSLVLQQLKSLDPNRLSPREALEKLFELTQLADS